MKKALIIIAAVAGLLYLTGYWLWYGYLPPETPRKVIGSFLKQSPPSDWKIKHYRYEWEHLIHDGTLEAVIEIPENEVASAFEYLPRKTFIEGVLPSSEDCFARSELPPTLTKYLNPSSKGIYTCKVRMAKSTNSTNDMLVGSEVYILDRANRHLIVFAYYL